VTRAWQERLAAEDGVGCLAYIVGVPLGILAIGMLLDVSGPLGWIGVSLWVWAIASAAGLAVWSRRRREQRRLRRARRAQRRALSRVGKRRYAERPIDETSPLPREWWEPVSLARKAVRDYRHCVESLPRGPVRERLAEGIGAMQSGAAQLEDLARRGAELDRQLTRFRARTGEENHSERIAALAARVAEARSRVAARLEVLQLAALDVANVAVSMSLSEAEALVSGVEDTLTGVAGLAAALDDVGQAEASGAGAHAGAGAGAASTESPPASSDGRCMPQPAAERGRQRPMPG
jgi:hypothetical protein